MDAVNAPHAGRRCWAEIDFAALRHNVRAVRAHLGEAVRIMAVAKADAYGHGAQPVARALAPHVEMFAVANLREARELREAVAEAPIYLLGPALAEERAEIVARGFLPAISTLEEALAYDALAEGRRVPIHLTIDSGMGRIGVWEKEALKLAKQITALAGVQITGFATHLPVSDEDDACTAEQLRRFDELSRELRTTLREPALRHSHNSAGIIGFPGSCGEMVRAGLMLYGSSPRLEFQARLRPVLTWKTRVVLVRDFGAGRSVSYGRTFLTAGAMRIATLAVGYADGYPRHLSNENAEVLIRGWRCAVLGRVTMDQIMVDVTALPEVAAGEEVVLLGAQGSECIPAAELAKKAGTIPWEIFTGLGARVERVYEDFETVGIRR